METGKLRSIEFWDNVKDELVLRGMSWQDLAAASGLSAQCLASARYLGSSLRILTVLKIADALDVSAAKLAGVTKPVDDGSRILTFDMVDAAWTLAPELAVALILPALPLTERREISKTVSGMLHRRADV